MSSEIITIARTIGTGGGGILAVVLAIWLAIKAINLAREMIAHRNGTPGNPGNPNLEELRLICPVATGRRTLDDLHDVLVELVSGIGNLTDKQDSAAVDSHNLTNSIADLRVEIARGRSRGV